MNKSLKHSIGAHSVRLGLFALFTAGLLSLVNIGTAGKIESQLLKSEQMSLDQIMPPTSYDNDLFMDKFSIDPTIQNSEFENLALLGLSEARTVYIAKQQNQASGIILPLETHDAYSGDIELKLGIDLSGKITGVRVISHSETPGLGDKIELRVSNWILGFDNRSLTNPLEAGWQIKKQGGEFDQFVGATITPRAVVNAVKNALLFFELNKTQLLQHETDSP